MAITSPINNSTYRISSDTSYALLAVLPMLNMARMNCITDGKRSLCTIHHISSRVILIKSLRPWYRGSGAMETYYWFVKLTVTDAAGLSTIDSSKIFPQCGPPLPIKLLSFSVSGKDSVNTLTWTTTREVDLEHFEIMRKLTDPIYQHRRR